MHIHILGICGTFMGGAALLARALGHRVTGSDANVYPPMSTLLAEQGIDVSSGYEPAHLEPAPDLVVIGNALSRGNPAVEHVLDRGLRYTSGPAFLADHVLAERWVLAVAGTHGKTTTSSMLAWILEDAGLAPGFLIGGVPRNFGVSARLGDTPFFVVEADEYDTAFFDKRSKFVHYRPRTAVLNNLEFDHADIFPDLAAIQRQFHHLVRTVPGSGLIIAPHDDPALDQVLAEGCWTPVERSGDPGGWHARLTQPDGSAFEVWQGEQPHGTVRWGLLGAHNVQNALHALLAARHAGVAIEQGCAALGRFESVKRRLELRGEIGGVAVYDDFAHHPTAIATTLQGLRRRAPARRLVALLEPRSNTMRMGVHKDSLADSLREADAVFLYAPPDLGWSLEGVAQALGEAAQVHDSVDALVAAVVDGAGPDDHIVVMSNGAFGGVHERLLAALKARVAGAVTSA
ncbi:UDP-N-acetylmuramate:L-alanyl-gamma-D-glutamyl-meso-diaminopimelate ligase [Ectothiorhodospiraceae bacterium 2226]|nr:UDP-N-acetylmuramate:L-alanyl-gamma-D-glutamyl-meso-diaminopimelate ligase [Ectothiorhodospiraceae bacterium 2226]